VNIGGTLSVQTPAAGPSTIYTSNVPSFARALRGARPSDIPPSGIWLSGRNLQRFASYRSPRHETKRLPSLQKSVAPSAGVRGLRRTPRWKFRSRLDAARKAVAGFLFSLSTATEPPGAPELCGIWKCRAPLANTRSSVSGDFAEGRGENTRLFAQHSEGLRTGRNYQRRPNKAEALIPPDSARQTPNFPPPARLCARKAFCSDCVEYESAIATKWEDGTSTRPTSAPLSVRASRSETRHSSNRIARCSRLHRAFFG